jgi:pyruvate dehydrogenase E2 component (dihydrolipoamide acetyltransferase)
MPELGENIESGDVVSVFVRPGEEVAEGQTVLELETDKAVVEVPSTLSGIVSEVFAQVGQRLKVGDLIFKTAAGSGAAKHTTETQAPPTTAEPESDVADQNSMAMARHSFRSARTMEGKTEEEAFPRDAMPEIESQLHPAGLTKHAGHEHKTVPAAPIVRKLAREIGVDIYLVKGSGPGGRISEADVKAFAKGVFARMADPSSSVQVAARAGAVVVKLPDFSRWGKIEKVSLRGVRRKTAEHLALAWNVIPHVTQFDKADVSDLEELRKRFAPKAEKAGGKMTMTAIALKVVASGLKAFPQFNASIDMATEEIIYKRYINIGVAVDTDRGLLVPVIRDVDKKNIIELAVELSTISKKARDKKLTAEDMEGGSFTITNLGGVGGTAFTPIVNHPEVAILGMSRSRMEPVWMNGKFEPRTMLPLSLSYDHRIIDGADAARFTRWIVDALEQPFLLSVQG